ncbi:MULTISPECIES: carboxymuconolactone decarboxylase family protein [Bradyrhizobium]|uniref:carboxymuconolactone decarboxylase family protein n=1 Tax=Bradyrhizobium TaxID=374 RepID=UPI000484B1F3|nr:MULTISPECIES: carboxymuconolactone decarboxylase family protein [Bradyrhizobium]UFW46479.1 carboxymuconolactone decarboxylase family protein [Bradyrhizobium arachidis]
MEARLNPFEESPDAMKALMSLESYVSECGLEHSLIELIKIRASQINACSFCVHMHTRDARAAGETEERIYLLSAWHESPLYTARERAALAWTDSLTLLVRTHAPDRDYEPLKEHFTPDEMVKLSLLIGTINTWNRMMSGFRTIHPIGANQRRE